MIESSWEVTVCFDLLLVLVAGPSIMPNIMFTVNLWGSWVSTNLDRLSAALFLVLDIHSNVMLYDPSSKPHLLIFVLALFPFKKGAKGLWCFPTMTLAPCR